ncbi:MAG: type IV toxin-antitoxin system AbiEi family antitoxin [Acidobacteriota bacterium]
MNERVLAERTIGGLQDFLGEVPAIFRVARKEPRGKRQGDQLRPDALLGLSLKAGGRQTWIVEARSLPLEPKAAEMAAFQVKKFLQAGLGDYGVVTAPFVSPRAAEILQREGMGYFDLSGNCLLVSGALFIERGGHPNAFARKGALRSLFTPAAERVLRALLDPENQRVAWTLRALAQAAYPGVSLGQVHKVRLRLEEQAYLQEEGGIRLREPAKLLEEWAKNYRFERNGVARYYSPLQPAELRARFLSLVTAPRGPLVLGRLASFTAAEVLAPQVRQFRFFAYWQGDAAELAKSLELRSVSSGDNVVIYWPYDEGVLYPAVGGNEPVTAPVQTYLDLMASASRGEDAAESVFEKCLKGAYGG